METRTRNKQSLRRILKMAIIFAILNPFNQCNAVATTPSESSPIVSTISGAFSSFLSTRGYSLTKAELWKPGSANGGNVFGFKLTFSSDCCGGADITQMYGTTGSGNTLFFTSILKKVTKVTFLYNSWEIRDIEFGHPDGSNTKICGCGGLSCYSRKAKNVTGSFIGMAVKNDFPQVDVDNDELSIWNDSGGNQCTQPVTSISWDIKIVNQADYLLYGNSITTSAYQTDLLGICFSPTLTLTFQKNGLPVSQPTWLNHDATNMKFTYSTTTAADIGVYAITMICAYSTLPSDTYSFTITIKHDCVNTTFSAQTVNAMTITVGASATTQSVPFPNSIATTRGNAAYCGANSFIFVPSLNFLTVTGGNTLNGVTSSVDDVSVNSVTVSVSLIDYPGVPSITKTFTVTVICTISALSMSQTSYSIEMANQPFLIAFTQTQSCGVNPTLSPSTDSFMSLISLTSSGGNVQVSGFTAANLGTKNYTLTRAYLTQTQTVSFSVILLCTVNSLTFSTSVPSTQTIQVGINSQPYTIPFAIAQSPSCNKTITFTLTQTGPATPYITVSLSGVTSIAGNVQVNGAVIADHGTYSYTLSATIAADSQSIASNFNVIIKDPCSTAVFQTSPAPILDMIVSIPSTGTQSQTIKILTDIEAAYLTIVCPITATLSPYAAFISIGGSSATIDVIQYLLVAPADLGPQQFTLTVNSSNFSTTVASQTYNFNVIGGCIVTSLTFSTSVPSTLTIQVGITSQPYTIPFTITQSPACNKIITFTLLQTVPATPYTPVSLQGVTSFAGNVQVSGAVIADHATYSYTLTAAIAVDSQIIAQNFNVIIKDPCSTAVFQTSPAPIVDMTVSIPSTGTQSQTIKIFTDVEMVHPTIVCSITATLSPPTTYISIGGSSTTIDVNRSLLVFPTNLGLNLFTLTVNSSNFSSTVTAKTFNFNLIVSCTVASMTFSTSVPPTQTIQVGITSQPYIIPFTITQSPACNKTITFTLLQTVPATPYTPVSLSGVTSFSGNLQVSGAVIADHATYSYTLTAAIAADSQIIAQNFNVIIKDPCSTAVFQTSPTPIVDMTMVLFYNTVEIKTQAVKIITDVEVAHPSIVCSISAVLAPIKPFLTLKPDFTLLTVTGSNTNELDSKIYPFTLTVISPIFSAVTAAVYNFTLNLQQCISSFAFQTTVANLSYKVNQGVLNTSQFQAVQNPIACNFPITYSLSMSLGGVAFPNPTWITFDTINRKIEINQSVHNDVGLFTLTVDATIPLTNTVTSAYTKVSFLFTLNVLDDCVDTVFFDQPITSMLTKVSQAPAIQNINFKNTISVGHADLTYCGPLTQILTPNPSILTISGGNLILVTANPADLGIRSVVLLTSLTNHSSISISKSFTIEVQCEVNSITSTLVPNDVTFLKDDPAVMMLFNYVEFPLCGLSYTLSPSLTFVSMDLATKKIKVESLNYTDRGQYKMRLDVISAQGINLSKSFTIFIVDVCTLSIFEPKVLPNIEVFVQDKTRVFYQLLGLFSYDTKQKKNFDCGEVEIIFTVNKDTKPPMWTSLSDDKSMLTFDLQQQTSKIPKILFELTARLEKYPDRNTTTSFNFTQSTLELECLSSKSVIYNLDTDLTFSIGYINKTFTSNPVTPVFQNYVINKAGAQISIPGFAKYNRQSNDFSIRTNEKNDLGTYKFNQKISYQQNSDYSVTCTTDLVISYVSDFKGDFIKDVVMNCIQPQKIYVPEFTDLFGFKAQLIFKLDSASQMFRYDDKLGLISLIDGNTSLLFQFPGEYVITYILVDQLQNQKSYKFKIYVTCFNIKVSTTETVVPQRPTIIVDNPPQPFIQSIDQVGKVRIAFTQKIQIPTFGLYPEFKGSDMMRPKLNSTVVGNSSATQKRRSLQQQKPTELSSEDKEQQAIEIINRGIVKINNTDFPLVELKMNAGNQTDPIVLNFTYDCVAFKETFMDFAVKYINFSEVSIKDQKDSLQAVFYGSQYFRTEADTTFRQDTLVEISKNVPQQLDKKVGAMLAGVGSAIQNGSKAVVVLNFILNMALSGMLQEMFAAMKKMQLMIHLLLVNVVVPASCQMFFNSLLNLVIYNIVDLSPYLKRGFKLDDDVPMADNFDSLGYNSHFLILNMSNFFVAFVIVLCIFALIIGTIPLAYKFTQVQNLRQRLMKKMMWVPVLDLFNESYLGMAISIFINLYFWQDQDNTGKKFNLSLSTTFIFCMVIAYPIFCLVFLVREYDNLAKDWYREKFGSLYENFQFTRGKIKVLEPIYSAIRRLIMALVLVFLHGYPTFQILAITYSWCVIIIITGHIRPFKEPKDYLIDCINEFFILLLIYHLICFADFVKEYQTQTYVGWSMVFVMMFNIGINFSIILWGSIVKLYKSLRTKYWQWKLSRIVKKRAKDLHLKEQIKREYLSLIGLSELQDQENQKNSFFRSDFNDHEEQGQIQSFHQEKNQFIEESVDAEASPIDRIYGENFNVIKRRRSLSDAVAGMNMKDLQIQDEQRQQDQDNLELKIVAKTRNYFKNMNATKRKTKVKTKLFIQKEQSLSVISEDNEGVEIYADNIFDKYHPPRLAVEAMVLEPITDPFCIGLEGIRLAKAIPHVVGALSSQLVLEQSFGRDEAFGYPTNLNLLNSNPTDDIERYYQNGDIQDPFTQLSRVQKRHMSIRNQFRTLDQSKKKFDDLWTQNSYNTFWN